MSLISTWPFLARNKTRTHPPQSQMVKKQVGWDPAALAQHCDLGWVSLVFKVHLGGVFVWGSWKSDSQVSLLESAPGVHTGKEKWTEWGAGLKCNRGLHDATASSEAGVALQNCPNSDKKPDLCTSTVDAGVHGGV